MHTMNADDFINKYETSLKHISEKVCSFSYTTLYKHLKLLHADFLLHRYEIELEDVYVTKKEKENNRRKV
jgi:hypothetical protein